ncbi:TetR/AcrR family transcriptional regulator C-terminal domain-containing protein [Sporichthya sp.]|uniref:TetR/AcrR family transcriptional regulator C-terminal domain-containing protein n=1 Tax=Sporichthya sp. TaxID=65475 RepID=UPI0018344BE1|nr:TetR/AcrR family transcriptional regulator C-terminal domain-containing protein [Sporichthya sp.]MBA3741657.1 TetR/AcrR family transcriptional regulator C-terminal domain-containing protein [Sporichthya sp.]
MAGIVENDRARLSREAIVATAIRLIEAEGEAAASMRRISAELGVAAMSLYNHVPNKAALLDAIGEHVRAQILLPTDPDLAWEQRARVLMRAFRDVVEQYPRCIELMMARAPASLVGLEPLEYALEMAEQAGFTGRDALRVVRAFVAYAVGATTTAGHRARAIEAMQLEAGGELSEPPGIEKFPRINNLGLDLFAVDESDFEFGLDLMIQTVTQLRAGR